MDIHIVRGQLKTKTVYDIPLRVTYYARVSSESDEQLNSLGNQLLFEMFHETEADVEALIEEYIQMYKALRDEGDIRKKITEQERHINLAAKKKAKLLEYNVTGQITDQNFISMTKQCDEEIKQAEHEIFELGEQENSRAGFKAHIDNIRRILRDAEKDAAQGIISKDFIDKYIDKIFVTPLNGELRLEIKLFTGESTEKFLAKLKGRTDHTFKKALQTPAILLDLDILENNLKCYQQAADKYGKQIWPMVKTHKSAEMARMQKAAGATGFLCGTLDECEALCEAGLDNIMYAYPVAGQVNIGRVIKLSKRCNFYLRIDDLDGAGILNEAAENAGATVNYTIIVDSGLHRFGRRVEQLVSFADAMKDFKSLVFKGISTHPGHVYGCGSAAEVPAVVADEKNTMKAAVEALRAAGYTVELVTSGSTPTFMDAVDDEVIGIYHPGNYVFMDSIQMSIDCARENDCALSVFATVISHPQKDLFIIDAGAKCLGLDQGAHGNSSIKGFGYVKGHPELVVYSLSEEVGKLHVEGSTNMKVGDQIEIIPNHSCSSANLTACYIGCRGEKVEKVINVDIRGNSTTKRQ